MHGSIVLEATSSQELGTNRKNSHHPSHLLCLCLLIHPAMLRDSPSMASQGRALQHAGTTCCPNHRGTSCRFHRRNSPSLHHWECPNWLCNQFLHLYLHHSMRRLLTSARPLPGKE